MKVRVIIFSIFHGIYKNRERLFQQGRVARMKLSLGNLWMSDFLYNLPPFLDNLYIASMVLQLGGEYDGSVFCSLDNVGDRIAFCL